MKVAELLAERHQNWAELQRLCVQMSGRSRRKIPPATVVRFATLYRAACADLALADAYQLPPNTVQYLHQLVAQSHNLLYRSRTFQIQLWVEELFVRAPQRLFTDRYIWIAGILFYGLFAASFALGRWQPNYAEQKLGKEQMEAMVEMYSGDLGGRSLAMSSSMAGFYVNHNASIGLRCFASGVLLFGVGGLFEVVFNAVYLGAAFGYMSTTASWDNFRVFVTAHAPFELTAIVLSAAAGMRLGFAVVSTGGLTRQASIVQAGREAMPVAAAALLMFVSAAFIEGYISPSALPYWTKATVAAISSGLLMFYFVILGMPISAPDAPPSGDGTWEGAIRQLENEAPSPAIQ